MRECNKCRQIKPLEDFNREFTSISGRRKTCKTCFNAKTLLRRRSKIGLINNTYTGQKIRCKKRGDPLPSYTKEEFLVWMLSQPNFESLYAAWVKSNYNRNLSLSVDREEEKLGYTIFNIKLMTWEENNLKAKEDIKAGKLKSRAKEVICTNLLTKEIIEFKSAAIASRALNIPVMGIYENCSGKYETTKGYNFKYKL